jgi:uncharacterized membrane protein
MESKDSGMLRIKRGVTVNREIEDVYRFWRNFEQFPSFMYHVESVTVANGRSHWVVTLPGQDKAEWDAEIVTDQPNQLIAWRTLPHSKITHEGSVEFRPAPVDRGTEVRVEMRYQPPDGAFVMKLFGADPDRHIRDDLHRFKQLMETGEVLLSHGAPEGVGRKPSKQLVSQPQAEAAQR